MLTVCVALLLFVALTGAAHSGAPGPGADAAMDRRLDQLFGEHAAYHEFLTRLRTAVASNARERVAAMVSYPLTVRIGGRAVRLRNGAAFLRHYRELLPPGTREVLSSQTYAGLFANSQGVMIGSGQIWFAGVCADATCTKQSVRITAINPDAAGPSVPVADAGAAE